MKHLLDFVEDFQYQVIQLEIWNQLINFSFNVIAFNDFVFILNISSSNPYWYNQSKAQRMPLLLFLSMPIVDLSLNFDCLELHHHICSFISFAGYNQIGRISYLLPANSW